MKAYTGSSDSKQYNEAYFTNPDDVKWCLSVLDKIYSLEGKTALDPAAGACIFSESAPELKWVTNELYPEFSEGREHDFNVDFAKGDRGCFGRYDFVITNPPYGVGSHTAKKFVSNALEHTDIVAMVLPKAMRRYTYWDKKIPRDCKIIFEEGLPVSSFTVPSGKVKKVSTFFLILERVEGYERPDYLEYIPEGYRLEPVDFRPKRGDIVEEYFRDWATHALCLWGCSGQMVSREEMVRPYVNGVQMRLTPEQAQIVSEIDWAPYTDRTFTTFRHLAWAEVVDVINKALRSR